jgi:hypothetical protein
MAIEESYRALVEKHRLAEPAADQLRQAAHALATMPAGMATSITCTRHVPAAELAEFGALAGRLAAEHGLAVQIEPGDPVCVRFSHLETA